jgi:uncharacterized protein (DUF362 family)
MLPPFRDVGRAQSHPANPLFWIKDIPDLPFYDSGNMNYHIGVDSLLHLMGGHGLKLHRSHQETDLAGPSGLIDPADVVLIKVNAQWKYRGCTNSDLVRGLIQRILDHPDGFEGEVVIVENGQGRGSLNCDTEGGGYPDDQVHANANDESHSFLYLVRTIFNDPRVSPYLLDPVRTSFIESGNHSTDGYRRHENVSYPCFTTAGGRRVELREGVWQGNGYRQNLKLINIPVLKYHDTGGSEITASLKHFYGVVSMADGQSGFRHYGGLGETCGKMVVSIRTPVLNIIDAIWVSHSSLAGWPAATTLRANQILASQDPVALDYWAAKYILYPLSGSQRHLPDFPGIDGWLTGARDVINSQGGLNDPDQGILVGQVTKDEQEMVAYTASAGPPATISLESPPSDSVFGSGFLIKTYPPSFQFATTGNFLKFKILFSLDPLDFTDPVARANMASSSNQWTPSIRLWKRIMGLSDNHGSVRSIYWRILGIKSDRTVVESEARSIQIDDPLAPSVLSPVDGDVLSSTVPPTISFRCNSNITFQLQFSSSSDIGNPFKIGRISPTGRDPNTVTDIQRPLTPFQWAAVKKRVGEGTGYLRIKASDGINRETLSEVIGFTLH